jgi:putative ABC transport system permease protein
VRWRDVLDLALESQRMHRLRTGLTLTAIAIGVTAVLLLTALGEAAKAYVVQEFASLGTNIIAVVPGKTETTGMPAFGGATRDLTIDDAEAILHRAPSVRLAAPVSMGSATFAYGGRTRNVRVFGTTAEIAEIRSIRVAAGRFLPPGDPRVGAQVAVLGPKLAREVFRDENPLGKAVRVGQWRFRVIGVMEAKGQSLGFDFDDMVMIPAATGLNMFDQTTLFRIMVQARDATSVHAAREQVRRVLAERHRDEDFTLITQDAMTKTFGAVIDALTAALAGIAAISLAVAGIGIMNVMLVSVSERSAEVGLFKALGARRRQILRVFLVEATLLSASGALVGTLVGVSLILAAAGIWRNIPLRPGATWIAVVLALAMLAGVVFGLMPARRAAALSAADALRGKR